VRKGDVVKKGQLLLKLDDAIYQQNIRASRESIATLKTQLQLALDLLKRQQNLWNQGIGTEVQLLTAKNNVETLETQIKSAEEQVKVLLEQQKTTLVYAEVSGIVDEVNVKVGEFFQGMMGNMPQIRIVNTSSLKVVTNIPENYAGKVSKGSKVEISIPDVNRTYSSSISFLSASIDPGNRGFETEAKLPADRVLKPNMVAMVKILDYSAPAAITVPVNVIQSDEKGKYVFVAVNENGKMIARKKAVAIGQMQGERIEIKAGLNVGEKLVTRGYQGLYDGQVIAEAPII
jgi:RND family efflux transporter MFP subunit